MAADRCPELYATASGIDDYRLAKISPKVAEHLRLVEGAHFTESVRRGLRGNTAEALTPDLDYTLKHFPNHHGALFVMANHQLDPNFKPNVPGRTDYFWPDMACYFKRAHILAPDDDVVYLLEGIIAHKSGKTENALVKYSKALDLNAENAETHYNLALLYIETKQLDKAKQHAEIAYKLGYQLHGLRNKLKKLGIKLD